MKLPEELDLNISELATWYSVVKDKNHTINYEDLENRFPQNMGLPY